QLLYGKDPQIRRLAQEIVTDQQSEIEFMQLWLKAHEQQPSQPSAPGQEIRQAPWARASGAISSRDRVYAANQTSNTVSVIDPSSNTLLGVIRLGDPAPGSLSALYRGELLVHGLGFSPDARTLAVVSVGSNSVTLIDTATNAISKRIYVGRSPHEAFFTPD